MNKKTILPALLFTLLGIAAFIPEQTFAHKDHEHARNEAIERLKEARQERPERASRFEYQKEVLLRAIDSLTKHAELLSERVENVAIIQEDTKIAIQDEIQADIAKLKEFKSKVIASETSQELTELAAELKEYRADITQKKVRKLMLLVHIGVYEHHLFDIASQRADSITQKLDEFAELGKEVTALEDLLQQAKDSIEKASTDLALVKQDIAKNDIDETAMAEVHNSLQNIREKIKDTYSIFRDIAKQAKKL